MQLYRFIGRLATLTALCLTTGLAAQDMSDYTASWTGHFDDPQAFNLRVELRDFPSASSQLLISNRNELLRHTFAAPSAGPFEVVLAEGLRFSGRLSADGQSISGFMQSGILQYHLQLRPTAPGQYRGQWRLLMLERLANPRLYLSVENGAGDRYEAYPFWGDQRFTGTWCTNFQKEGPQLRFMDFKTGLQFQATLETDQMVLDLQLAGRHLTRVSLHRTEEEWQLGGLPAAPELPNEEWTTIDPNAAGFDAAQLARLTDSLAAGAFPNTHSVLIATGGQLLYEAHFQGYDGALLHDTRSASKSIASALVGVSVDEGLVPNTEARLYDWLPENLQSTGDSLKRQIDLASLLTMSSGLDADDYDRSQRSAASENAYQSSPDWTTTVLNASMVHPPNAHAMYGSANPYLLGLMMQQIIPEEESVAFYLDEKLFQPLGITDYIVQNDEKGQPYFGGGMYLNARHCPSLR